MAPWAHLTQHPKSWSVQPSQPCLHGSRHAGQSLHFTMGRPFCLKTDPSDAVLSCLYTMQLTSALTHLIMVPKVHPTTSRSVQPFLQGPRSWQTDRQTDHDTSSVTIGRIYVVLRCGLKIRQIERNWLGNNLESCWHNTGFTGVPQALRP